MTSVGSVAVLCDIHGNLPALDAVLAELHAEPADAVVVGGDVAAGSTCVPAARGCSTPEASARPYEREPGAYWLRLGPGVDLRRTPYDTRAAVAAFRELGYPDAEGMVPAADPDEVAAMFEAGADEPPAPESRTGR